MSRSSQEQQARQLRSRSNDPWLQRRVRRALAFRTVALFARSPLRSADHGKAVVREHALEPQSVLLESIGARAADLIVDQAREWQVDLIVMGTHGRRGLRRLALGSDAELVVRSASVPVLLIREHAA